MKRREGHARSELVEHTLERLRALSDGINEVIYVSDPETYKILFANRHTQQQFGGEVVGRKCHKVFRNLGKPCPSCTNKYIFGKNLGKTYIWDHQNPMNERWYRGIFKAIKWSNGKFVRYTMAIDITDQKTTEKALKHSEERFHRIAENTLDLIYRYSPQKGIEYVNPASLKITGYTPDQLCASPDFATRIILREDRRKLLKAMDDFSRHRQPDQPIEIRWRHKDGRAVVTELVNVPVYDEKRKLIAVEGIARDVTERRVVEEALRDSEKKFRTISDSAQDGIIVVDDEGRISYWNQAAGKIFGYKRSEIIGKDAHKLIARQEDRALFAGKFRDSRKTGQDPKTGRILELVAVRKDATEFPIELSRSSFQVKRKLYSVGIIRDITERRRMEEAVRASEDFFRSVVENSHDAILILDSDFRITYANKEAESLGGYSREEIVGKDFRRFLAEENRQLVLDTYRRRQRGEDVPSQYTLRVVRKDGSKRIVEVKSTVVREKSGKSSVIAQLHDITEFVRIEEERKHFEAQLSALNTCAHRMNTADEVQEIYKLTLDAMERLLGFEYASILRVEGKMLSLVANRGYQKSLSVKLPLDGEKGITVRAATTGKPVFIPDIRKEKTYVKGGKGIRSELTVPIKVGNKVLGVLNVENRRIAAFDDNDRELLEILASHAAIAITTLSKQKRLSALNEYGKNLNMARNLNEIYSQTLDAMEETLGFEFATFFIAEDRKLRLTAHRGYPKKLNVAMPLDGDKGVSLRAARRGAPVFVPDTRNDSAYIPGRPGMLSELAVPIKKGSSILGVLNVESERIAAFDDNDRELLEILASHAATAIGNLRRQVQLRSFSKRLAYLMKSTTEIIHAKTMNQKLKVIAKAVRNFGWRRVVISLRDENLEGTDVFASGLAKEELRLLMKRKAPGRVWQERLGPKFERFKIGEFHYLPWSDPWIRENVHGVPPNTPPESATTYAGVPSRLSPEETIDWHPQDMLYAPLRTPEGKIVGILSMDDPVEGRRPTRESLMPLELLLHQVAIIIENAQLFENLNEARQNLEQKVEERTQELRKYQEQLLKAQRLAVIGELAGMVGHDLRNPLTSIAGAAYYMKKRSIPKADVKIAEMLELVEKNIAYSNKIINDLLDYSKEIKLDLAETTPRRIVKEALCLAEIPANIRLKNRTENEPTIKIDIAKIKRTFVNIIRNAIDAMPKGGDLTVTSKKLNGNVEFRFEDTGTGMSKETTAKLWTPLFTTKAKGMGFGLPICKRIVDSHAGTIRAESTFRKGTVFIVTLPIETKTEEEGGEGIWIRPLESLSLTTTRT